MRPLAEKGADIAAFISNCGAKSFRLKALEMLSNNLTVDSYGRCFNNKATSDPKTDVLTRYKFSLAFENSQVPCCLAHAAMDNPDMHFCLLQHHMICVQQRVLFWRSCLDTNVPSHRLEHNFCPQLVQDVRAI
jgi:hypothetical protein